MDAAPALDPNQHCTDLWSHSLPPTSHHSGIADHLAFPLLRVRLLLDPALLSSRPLARHRRLAHTHHPGPHIRLCKVGPHFEQQAQWTPKAKDLVAARLAWREGPEKGRVY
ncbi:hypothetical protein LPJ66_010254 [Kickxella alabastrina]|uniref:Uncharacterized protein n=1 Tax=Kickxella alabastrina TaxID=61397 RepID=A0ACC1I752_9FUNG|nr:hypothetical protein LPJ66_010254 [Kickxella alabastrina]